MGRFGFRLNMVIGVVHLPSAGEVMSVLRAALPLTSTRRLAMTMLRAIEPVSSGRVILLDGGMGEELFRRGMPDDRKLWSAQAVHNPKYHALLQDVHASFIRAGSRIITTNNFSITREVGLSDEQIATLTTKAAQIAIAARDNTDESVRVWGALPPLNGCYRPDLVLSTEECQEQYDVMLKSLVPHVDGILCETLSSVHEMKAAMGAVLKMESANGLPISGSWTVCEKGLLRSGESADEAVNQLIDFAGDRLETLMFNCGLVEGVMLAVESLTEDTINRMKKCNLHLGVYPNRLTAVPEGWTMGSTPDAQPIRVDLDETKYTEWCERFMEKGVTYIGGCCGVYPSYIEEMNKAIGRRQAAK